MEVTKLKTLKVFLIIILKLSWKGNLYLKLTVVTLPSLTWLPSSWCEA